MERGSPEWLAHEATKVSMEAQPELCAIAEAAAKRHGADRVPLSQEDTVRIAMVLSEVQDQSFLLGIGLGMKLVKELIESSPTSGAQS